MADIFEILTTAGIEINDEQKTTLDGELRKSYKHISEVDKLTEKHKLTTEQLTAAQGNLADANAEIKKFQDLDIDGVKAAAADWESKYNKAQEESAAKIADMEYEAVLKDNLSGIKFTSAYAAQGIHAEIKAKKLPNENGKIVGIDDVLKAMRESQPDAFAPDKPPASLKFNGSGHQPLIATATKDDYKKMTYEQRLELMETNPTLYTQLTKKE